MKSLNNKLLKELIMQTIFNNLSKIFRRNLIRGNSKNTMCKFKKKLKERGIK